MTGLFALLVLITALASSLAWVPLQKVNNPVSNLLDSLTKDIASVGFAASVASAVVFGGPIRAEAADFTGSYADPNHPGCARLIAVEDGDVALVSGMDGNPGCPGGLGKPWKLVGKVTGDKIFIDFSPKGGPKDLTGVWEGGGKSGIRFPDGNKWILEAKP